jgi:predicted nucleic acid-binding protein
MNGMAFFDTNILVYADDASSPDKQARAIKVIADRQRHGLAVISLQVMQEYFVAATRKLGVDPELAQRKVELLSRGRVVRFAESDVIAAIELHRLTRISFWDAMIVHAARVAGAAVLYSEDMQHGGVVGGVPVVNPFINPLP